MSWPLRLNTDQLVETKPTREEDVFTGIFLLFVYSLGRVYVISASVSLCSGSVLLTNLIVDTED